MNLKQFVALTALATATAFIGTLPAEAARAVATGNVYVRSGPGSQHRIVGWLRPGERVEIARCDRAGRWCRIEQRRGRDGWVRSRYLSHRGSGGRHSSWGGRHRSNEICFHGTHGSICLGR